jgi:hypothetical protein
MNALRFLIVPTLRVVTPIWMFRARARLTQSVRRCTPTQSVGTITVSLLVGGVVLTARRHRVPLVKLEQPVV